MRIAVVAAAVCLSLLGMSRADDAKAAMRLDTHIPAESLGAALKALAQDRNLQVLYFSDAVRDVHTGGAVGQLTTDEALTQLLSGTGLTYRYVSEKAITILPVSTGAIGPGSASASPSSSPPTTSTDDQKEGKTSSSGAFLLAQAASGQAAGTPPVERQQKQAAEVPIQEVIVTAQKRNERLQDVPISVTAISGTDLVNSNQLRLQDYYTNIPGLTVTSPLQPDLILSIRGITTGPGTNPTVGVTIDDVPYGASTNLGGGAVVPDIDPGDLARVEVLRGPQGTLYGASSMGGLVKFVTVDPSPDALSGRVQAGTSSVYNGAELGYNVRGSVNVPLNDTLALRASAFTREDPGYIDNPVLGIDGVNESRAYGARLAALWRPSEVFSLKISALFQDNKADGASDVENSSIAGYVGPPLGDLQQNYIPGVGGYETKTQAYNMTLTAKLGSVDLTSLTGYNINQISNSYDLTFIFGPYTQCGDSAFFGAPCGSGSFPGFGVTGTPLFNDNKTSKFTQELRLSAPIGQHIDWLLGAFYTHESSQDVQDLLAEDPVTGARVGQWLSLSFPTTYEEYAGFTDLTFHFTDQFEVQMGGRESEIRQSSSQADIGIYDPVFLGQPSPVIYPAVDSKASAFTYLVTPQFRFTPDLMAYIRAASGYRAGGPNAAPGVPRQYDPDKTQDYEVGAKGNFLNHMLSLDASVYYIDWKNIQLGLYDVTSGQGYTANAGGAKSQGVEISAQLRPNNSLTIGAWVAWDDATLTKPLPPGAVLAGTYAVAGDRLPYSSRFSGNLSLDQKFPIVKRVTGSVGATMSYVGEREGEFVAQGAQRTPFPAYARTDLRAGVNYESWSVNLFANNVADRRGLLSGGQGYYLPFAFQYIQPRTVGLNIVKTF